MPLGLVRYGIVLPLRIVLSGPVLPLRMVRLVTPGLAAELRGVVSSRCVQFSSIQHGFAAALCYRHQRPHVSDFVRGEMEPLQKSNPISSAAVSSPVWPLRMVRFGFTCPKG